MMRVTNNSYVKNVTTSKYTEMGVGVKKLPIEKGKTADVER